MSLNRAKFKEIHTWFSPRIQPGSSDKSRGLQLCVKKSNVDIVRSGRGKAVGFILLMPYKGYDLEIDVKVFLDTKLKYYSADRMVSNL